MSIPHTKIRIEHATRTREWSPILPCTTFTSRTAHIAWPHGSRSTALRSSVQKNNAAVLLGLKGYWHHYSISGGFLFWIRRVLSSIKRLQRTNTDWPACCNLWIRAIHSIVVNFGAGSCGPCWRHLCQASLVVGFESIRSRPPIPASSLARLQMSPAAFRGFETGQKGGSAGRTGTKDITNPAKRFCVTFAVHAHLAFVSDYMHACRWRRGTIYPELEEL